MSIKSIKKGLLREPNFEDYMESKPSGFEVKWGTNPGDLLEDKVPFLRDLVEGTLNVIDPFLAGVNTFIELLDIVVDLLSAVAGVFFDAFSLITLAIREALESVINLFTGLSLNWMLHFPTTPKSRRNPDEIMYDLGMAYIDRGDTNRPITVQDSFGATVVALWSFPNLEKLMLEFNRINKLLKGVLDTNSPLDTRFSTLDTRYDDLIIPQGISLTGLNTVVFTPDEDKIYYIVDETYDSYEEALGASLAIYFTLLVYILQKGGAFYILIAPDEAEWEKENTDPYPFEQYLVKIEEIYGRKPIKLPPTTLSLYKLVIQPFSLFFWQWHDADSTTDYDSVAEALEIKSYVKGYIDSRAFTLKNQLIKVEVVKNKEDRFEVWIVSSVTRKVLNSLLERGIGNYFRRILKQELKASEYTIVNTSYNKAMIGQAPNFNGSLQLTQFGPIAKTVSTLAGWALIVGKGPSYSEKYKTIVVVAQRRLNRIAEQTQQLVSAIASMVSFLSLGAGSNMMLCTGTGKAEDFANALINAPLHPNYPSTDLSDINHNLSKQSSVLQKSEEAAKTLVFSGAVLLHFGISDPRADIQTLEKLLGILFKEFSAEELKETKFEPIGSRFDNL